MTMAAMVVAISASAQVYVGGTMGLGSTKVGEGDSKMSYKFVPELGYQLDENWDLGISIGYQGVEDGNHTFEVAPYGRYNFTSDKLVNFFLEGGFGFAHVGGNGADYDKYSIGIKPGVKVTLSKHVSFISKIGFLGYQQYGEGSAKVKQFGLNLNATNVQFGINYKF